MRRCSLPGSPCVIDGSAGPTGSNPYARGERFWPGGGITRVICHPYSLYLGCAGNDEHGTYGKSHLVLVLPPLFEYGLEPTTVVQVSISEIVAKYQVMRGSDPRDRMV